jgi:hypothetical protein
MKQVRRWGAAPIAVVSALAFVLVIAAGGAMAGGSGTGTPGERVGVPWTGAQGNQRTTSAIMAQQRAAGSPAKRVVLPEREANLQKQPNPDSLPSTTDAKFGAALVAPKLSVGTSFTGTTLGESGFVPPDSMGAVGPSQFLVVVNGRVKVFSKTGNVGSLNVSLDTFFSSVLSPGANVHTTDPRVRFDPLSGKWFVTAIDVNEDTLINNRVLLAVSDTDTITGGTVWTFFQFEHDLVGSGGDTNDFADFPTLGIDANALYIGANIFDDIGNFVNSSVYVVRKSSVTGAGPIVVTPFRDILNPSTFAGPYTPQGAGNRDPAATEGYFVGVDGGVFSKLDVLRVGTPGATPTLSGSLGITVPLTDLPLNPTVAGSSKPLDAVDDRLGSSSIVGGKLYTAQNIGVNSSGVASSATRDGVRWYELANLTTTPSLSRSGTIFDSSGSASSDWMPSLAVSSQGHALMGMSTGSSTTHPNGAVSSMLKGTSSFSAPANYTASSATYNVDTGGSVYRWGDFSHTSVDPCDGQTFWTIQEFVNGTDDWGVKVGKILAPPPATPASTTPTSVALGQASTAVTLTGTSTAGSGFWDPGSGSCRIAAAVDGNVVVNSVTFTDATHVTLDISTVGATAGTRTVTITNPDGQTAAAAVLKVGIAPANTALPTITGTATLGSTLTASSGTWDGAPAPTFAYQWLRCDGAGANCVNIASATATTYNLVAADVSKTIRVQVTATNFLGSSSADSAQTTAVASPPANTALPVISGLTQVGATLSTTNGTWSGSPTPTFTYQWEQCDTAGANCTDIASATSSTYLVDPSDAGHKLRVKVTGTNSVTAVTATSAATATITVPPANTVLPSITGTAAVGQVLTGNDGTWTGSPTPTLSRQWRRCDTGGANCVNIASATGTTYTLVQADASSTIRLHVTATSTSGTTSADSDPTATVTGPPVNTVLPTITGTVSRGQLLTATNGTWTGFPAPAFTYQWRQCDSAGANCADIGGATAQTYTPVAGDVTKTLRVVVTATNGSGSPAATSAATVQVTGSPLNSAVPTETGTTAKGEALTATTGTWTGFPAPTFAFGWMRCDQLGANCSTIGGATASTYVLVQADVGGTIVVHVTATNSAGSASADSVASATVTGPPANTALPTVTGTTAVGDTLTEHDGTWSGYPAPTFAYQWKQCDSDGVNCAPIVGATNNTYVIASTDQGYRLRVTVTATNGSGSASADSATKDVAGPPTNLAPPSISGVAQVGSVLTALHGSWTGVPIPTFTFQWQRCDGLGLSCVDIGGATGSTYTPVAGDVGSRVLVEVAATNTGGTTGFIPSAVSPKIVAAPVSGGGGGGGGGPVDVAISFGASPATLLVGGTLSYTVSASSVAGSASNVTAVINLPAGVTFVSASANRGPGCTGTTTVTCNLDFLSGSLVATVNIVTTATASGSLVATASLTTTPGDANTANNSATVTTVVTTPVVTPPPPPPLKDPVLKLLGTRTLLAAARHPTTESVAARFSTNERLRLSMNVTRLRSTTKLTILKGSRLDGSVAGSGRTTFTAAVGQGGKYALNTILTRKKLVKGATYVIHLTATNANGKKTTLAIRFKA